MKYFEATPAIKKLYKKVVKTAAQLEAMLKKLNQLIAKEKLKKAKKLKSRKKN